MITVLGFIGLLTIAGVFLWLLIELVELICRQFYLSVAKKKQVEKQRPQLTSEQLLLISISSLVVLLLLSKMLIRHNARRIIIIKKNDTATRKPTHQAHRAGRSN